MGIPGVPPVGRIDNGSSPLGFPPNMTEEDIQRMVRDQYKSMRLSIFDEATQTALIVAFAVLILFGACGNGLVCYVVAKNPNMRTPRNIFIINLAISDLTLCCFTQPFNLLKVRSLTLFEAWFTVSCPPQGFAMCGDSFAKQVLESRCHTHT